jgi:hypothetical protein
MSATEIHKVGRKFAVVTYRDGRYEAELSDKVARLSGCSRVTGSLSYVLSDALLFTTKREAQQYIDDPAGWALARMDAARDRRDGVR